MPSYNSVSKSDRMYVKEKVKEFLVSHLGGEDKLHRCLMWAKANNQLLSTYGIPIELEESFKKWAFAELSKKFGTQNLIWPF